jgi:Spy/CpxP family protein refolding chaperone
VQSWPACTARRQAVVRARRRPQAIKLCKTAFTSFYNWMTRGSVDSAYKRLGENHSREAGTMKTRKGIFLTMLALLLAAAVTLSAGGGKEHWAKLKQELNLTDAQVTQLEQKFEAIRPQGEALELKVKELQREIEEQEKAAVPDKKVIDEKRLERERLTKEWHEKASEIYRSVLTKEQFTKFQEMRAKEKKEYSEKKKKD